MAGIRRDGEDEAQLGVGQVAARSGVAVSALHYYEAQGLISSWRNAGNQRRYPRGVLRRVALIKVAQRLGLTLQSIRQALAVLPESRPPTERDWARLSGVWREELDRRIDTLLKLRDHLDGCIGCGCLSMKTCPLRNPGDQLATQGSGPRLLDPG